MKNQIRDPMPRSESKDETSPAKHQSGAIANLGKELVKRLDLEEPGPPTSGLSDRSSRRQKSASPAAGEMQAEGSTAFSISQMLLTKYFRVQP